MQHHFDVEIAQEYGLLSAVIFNHIVFWIKKNEADKRFFYDGEYWTHCTIAGLSELFPYASPSQIHRAVQKLLDADLLIKGNYNKNAMDRELWYAFGKNAKCILRQCKMDFSPVQNAFFTSEKCLNRDNIQDISKDNIKDKPFTSERMNEAFSDWLKYKSEKRQTYKPTGLAQLIKSLNNDIKERGEDTVIAGIRNSMKQNYSGIYYDNKKQPKKQESTASYDIDKAEHKMNTTVPKLKKRER